MASSIPPSAQPFPLPPIQEEASDHILAVLSSLPELFQQSVRSDVPSPRESRLTEDQTPLLHRNRDEGKCCETTCDCAIL